MTVEKQVFEFDRADDVLIVVPTGSLMEFRDADIRNAYNETYRLLSQDDTNHLLVDFSSLTYFGSSFVGMLIRLAKKARQGGGEAVLCNLSDNMRDMMKTMMLLENTKTDFFWVPFNSRSEAIAALNGGNPAPTAPAAPPPTDPNPPPAGDDAAGGWARFVK
ncbi:MAG: STAS domain-containing protein [Planctomycetaceae bacterium]